MDTLRILVSVGFALLLIMLRLDSERFGAAEYTEAARDGQTPALRRRLGWYLLGLMLIVGVDLINPSPGNSLFLRLGDRTQAIAFGFAFAAIGTLQAVGFAWLRYQRLRLPPTSSYPAALLNSIATAFIDEATFRAIFLAYLLATGMDGSAANAIQAIVYALSTRLGAPGRDLYMLVLVLVIGLLSGWLTIATGGIGAAFLGHAITRFAVFLTTGHVGRPAPRGREMEEIERGQRLPEGWQSIGAGESGRFDG
ncbi:MAG TPA: CPBP family glutamic-type intramembrane protease [Candidatus Saccharimonadales bacterium]|nr:CPBP family glutamic-type intramembrane protease [Candidatus Saccharimonadales bacterium]